MYVFLYTTNFRLVKILEKYWQHAHQNIPKMHLHYYYITTTTTFKKRSTPEKNKINLKKKFMCISREVAFITKLTDKAKV